MNVQYLRNTLRLTYEEGIQMLKVSLNVSQLINLHAVDKQTNVIGRDGDV